MGDRAEHGTQIPISELLQTPAAVVVVVHLSSIRRLLLLHCLHLCRMMFVSCVAVAPHCGVVRSLPLADFAIGNRWVALQPAIAVALTFANVISRNQVPTVPHICPWI